MYPSNPGHTPPIIDNDENVAYYATLRNIVQKCPKWGLAKILLKHEKYAICD
jgi:hypothetical protein